MLNLINRPLLLEELRQSILNNKITNIFGEPAVGKTALLSECLNLYFNDAQRKTQSIFLTVNLYGNYKKPEKNNFGYFYNEKIYIVNELDLGVYIEIVPKLYKKFFNKDIKLILFLMKIYNIILIM